MHFDALFTRAAALLPGPVRERLDGEFPLDWMVLEDADTGVAVGEAVRARRRLPPPVETLVHRLIPDLGIVPADVAAGVERPVAASAWIDRVTLEADGESYRLCNDRSGAVHAGIHPESVAGYAVLGMDLATLLHQAVERWLVAAAHHRTVPETERGAVGRCAVRMHEHLRARPETPSGDHTAASLARTLEHAWNSQDFEVRETLCGIRLSTARGASAPRRSYFAPITGHRLHACDAGELRWLRALAERAAAGAGTGEAERAAHDGRAAGEAASNGRPGVRGGGASASRRGPGRETRPPTAAVGRPAMVPASQGDLRREEPPSPTLLLGSDPGGVTPATEVAELVRAANGLPGAVRERLGETHGATIADAVGRLQDSRITGALRTALEKAPRGRAAPVVSWLGDLASALLADAGAQTRDGVRTGRARLEAGRRPEEPHRAIEVDSGAFGYLVPCGLVEQVRLGLAYAHDAWAGLAALRTAGREGEWALNEAGSESSRLAGDERETLEAARDIGLALGRIERARAAAHDGRPPSALDQAEMAAETLGAIGPTVRTAAGWPGAASLPNPRAPEDVARIAMVAEGLHGEIRTIANRLIAGWVAEVQDHGANRNA